MTTVAHPPKKGYRTIRLPLAESEYDRFLTDRSYAKDRLEELYEDVAELFPEAFPWGYAFFGFTEPSIKQQLLLSPHSSGSRPYGLYHRTRLCHALHDGAYPDVDAALFLMRFHVPCWAIAACLGRDPMYWYRLEQGLGRFSVVGTHGQTSGSITHRTWWPTKSIVG